MPTMADFDFEMAIRLTEHWIHRYVILNIKTLIIKYWKQDKVPYKTVIYILLHIIELCDI